MAFCAPVSFFVTHAVVCASVYGTPSTLDVVVVGCGCWARSARSEKSVLRIVSICWDARFAATERLRLFRVRFNELAMPTATPVMTMAKMKIAMTISTMVKPVSSWRPDAVRRLRRWIAFDI